MLFSVEVWISVRLGLGLSLVHYFQWRIQSWSQGGFPKVPNVSGW